VLRFIFGSRAERERLVDSTRKLRAAQLQMLLWLAPAVGLAGFHYGWAMTVPLVIAGSVFAFGIGCLDRFGRHREAALVGVWACVLTAELVAIGLAHGSHRYLYVIPMTLTLVASLWVSRRALGPLLAVTIGGLVATALLSGPQEVWNAPPILIMPCVAIIQVARVARSLRDADVVSRDTAVVDTLTGVLNRLALQARLAELEAQTRAQPRAISVVMADIDHFKLVNDHHGHATGDVVLTEVAARLSRALAGRGLLYRYGGEEFVALLPGIDVRTAADVAEELRRAVAAPVAGLDVSASFGVASPAPGKPFYGAAMCAAADAAMYAAKAAGRDCVRVAEALLPARSAYRRTRAIDATIADIKNARSTRAPATAVEDDGALRSLALGEAVASGRRAWWSWLFLENVDPRANARPGRTLSAGD